MGDTVKTLATNLKSNKLFWVLAIALLVRGVVLVWLPNLYFPDAGAYRTSAERLRNLVICFAICI